MENLTTAMENLTTAPKTKKTTKTYIVVVPVEGTPYIHGEVPKDDTTRLKLYQEIVGGDIERVPHGYYTVHPTFAREQKKWDIVRQLLNCKKVNVFVNEEGMRDCSPNVGLLLTFRMGVCPHAWGNGIMIVPENVLTTLKVSVDDLKEQCANCGEELGADYKEYDALTRCCKNGDCDDEDDE
jgi:hypothetical protein